MNQQTSLGSVHHPAPPPPQHIAIIMDGNGRWAKEKGFKRTEGHKEGVKRVQDIVEASIEMGIKYLTLYTFSTENWLRPLGEVKFLFNLLADNLLSQTPKMKKNGIQLHTIGDIKRMPLIVRTKIMNAIKETKHNDTLHLTLAVSYSSKWEIIRCVKQIAQKVSEDKLALNDINEEVISQHLTTKKIPELDLLIRTGGEHRISNFLLYQAAYSELSFTSTCWPSFSAQEYKSIIKKYQSKKRTFGKVSD